MTDRSADHDATDVREPDASDHPAGSESDGRGRGSDRRSAILWGLASLAILAVGGAVFWFLSSGGREESASAPQPPLVEAAIVERADQLTLRQTGFVRPRRQVAVAAEISGRIAEVGESFRLGETVGEGDLLIRIEQDRFEADVNRAEAAVEQARAALAEARVNRDRQAELQEDDFASEAALQQAIVAVAAGEADLAAARADLEQAEIALDETTVTAPFDGVVVEEDAAVGQLVQAGTTLGTLVSADAAEVAMGLTPSDIAVLGDPARALGGLVLVFASEPPQELLRQGVVVDVNPRIVAETRTVALVVRIPEPFAAEPRPIRIDELVDLALPVSLENRDAVEIPPEALKGQSTVWRISGGVLERVRVDPMDRGEGRIVLANGPLAVGERVMVSDLPAPFDGKRVRVADETGEAEEREAPGRQARVTR